MSKPKGWEVIPNVDRYDIGSRTYRDGEQLQHPESWHRAKAADMTLWFQTAMGRDARLVCTRLDIESDKPLTSSGLRRIPLTAILEDLSIRSLTFEDLGPPLILKSGLRRWYDVGADLDDPSLRELYLVNTTSSPATQRPKRGGEGPSSQDLTRFAQAYKVAVRTSPRRAIAETVDLLSVQGFEISRATAHRWRSACRLTDPPLLDPQQGGQS